MIKLLIVDDEKIIRMGIRNGIAWDKIGIDEVYVAGSVSEAMPIIMEESPQLLLIDIQLGKINGIDMIRQLREFRIQIQIVVMTSYDRFDYAHSCLSLNVQEFLLKPLDEEMLIEVMSKQVNKINKERIQGANQLGSMGNVDFNAYWKSILITLNEVMSSPEEIKKLFFEIENSTMFQQITDELYDKCCTEFVIEIFFHYDKEKSIAQMSLDKFINSLRSEKREKKVAVTTNFIEQLLGRDMVESSYLVNKIKIYIQKNLAESITVTSIADTFNMNAAYVSRLFKQVTGECCNGYIKRKRIEKAQYLLMNTDLKIYEVAEKVGFSEANYFCLIFKKTVGISPSFYRTAGKI